MLHKEPDMDFSTSGSVILLWFPDLISLRCLSVVSLLYRKAVLFLVGVKTCFAVGLLWPGVILSETFCWLRECGILFFFLVNHPLSWAAWVKHKLFSELLSVLPLITLPKKRKMCTFNFAFKDSFPSCHFWSMIVLHVWTAKCIHVVLLPWRTAEINFTLMEEQHEHCCLFFFFFNYFSVYYPVCDCCIFLCPCVRDKQDIQYSENLNRKRQGDKQMIPISSLTGTAVHQRLSGICNGVKFHMFLFLCSNS